LRTETQPGVCFCNNFCKPLYLSAFEPTVTGPFSQRNEVVYFTFVL